MRIPGRLAWAAAGLAAVVVAAIVLVHTPSAARWGRDWIVRQVAERWQLDLAASRFALNLFTGRVSLDDVRLSAPGHADEPFLTARRVTVTLPWSVVRGIVQLADLDVEDARVLLVREGGVMMNLPPPSGNPPPLEPRKLDVRGLQIRQLDLDYIDRTGDVDVSVRGLRAALTERDIRIFAGASGTIDAASITARLADHSTTSGPVAGRMAFDGSNVSLQALTAPFPEGTVVADGRINRVLDDVRFALTVAGSLDLAAVAAWTPPPVPVTGKGTFDGTFEGPLGGYELRAKFGSEAMTIGRQPALALAGVLTLTSPRAVIEPLTITTPPQGGTARRGVFDGRFAYEFGAAGTLDLGGAFRDLDLDVALALYEQEPLSIAAWQSGTISLRRDTPLAPLRLRATGRSAALVRADRVALDGTWDATLERERWFARHDHRLLDTARAYGTVQWLAGGDPARTALAGPVTLEISDLGPAIRAARRSGIGMSEALVDLKGTAQGALTVGGTLERTVVTGRVASRDLVLPTGAGATAGAEIVYDEESLSATAFELATTGARMNGHVRMGMLSSQLEGAFEGSIDSMPEFLAPWTDARAVSGTLAIAGTIGGTTDVPDVPLRVQSTPITYEGQRVGTIDGEARLLGTDLHVDRLTLDQGAGQLRASGRVDYVTYAYEATLEGRGLEWARPVPGVQIDGVVADVSFSGAGTLDAPGGTGTLSIIPTGDGVGDLIGSGDVRWQFANGTLNATAFLPKLRAFAQATVEPRAPYAFRGTALVSRLDVQPLALSAGALTEAVSGTVDFSAAFDGSLSDLDAARAFVNLQDVDVSVGGLAVGLERPARLTVRADDFTVDDLAVRAGSSTLTVGGRFRDPLDQPLRASFSGNIGDVVALAAAFGAVPPGVAATGAVVGSWESRGSLASARSTVAVTNAALTLEGLPPITALTAGATFDGSTLAVEKLSARWQDGAIEGHATIPRELLEAGTGGTVARAGRVDVTLVGVTEKALAPWLPAATLASMTGRVSATLALDLTTADLDGVRGTLVLDEASLTASGVPIAQARPGRLSIANRVLSFDDVEFSAGVPVRFGGRVTFGDTTALDVTVTGTPGLRPFSALLPQMAVDGIATVDLAVTGTPDAPRIQGRVDLDDAEVVMRDPRVIASDITGPILFEGDRISIPKLTGFLNGGSLEAAGAVTLSGLAVTGGEVTFQANGVAVEYPQNVDSEIDALLILAPGAPSPVLRGDVRVVRSSYRATISVPALVAFNATAVAAATEPTYLDRLRLDVSLTTEDDMIIDNNYGRFEAGAAVRLQGTAARPGVTGRAELREGGEIFLLGGVYRLNASSIAFTNPSAIEPDMNISMFTQQDGGEVTVTLSGTLDRLDTSVSSSSPDGNPNLLDVLLGGSTSLTGTDALALLSGDLLGVTGRAIGLDALRIERGFEADLVRQDPGLAAGDVDDTATRLTLSKQVRADVEVILSRELAGRGGVTAVVSYRPWRHVELRGTSRDDTDRTYAVRHELSFGGGTAVASAPPRPVADVAEVRIEGAVGDEEAALRDELRLVGGKRFDFIRWREDVDRLQQWYHGRGFLEARVRASRAASQAAGRVALTYRVVRGPRTELRVTGTTLPSRLRRTLERSWSDGVFDGFRLEEMQGEVALDLVRRDIIGARVAATVAESAADGKVITVAVQGGEHVSSKAIVFEGAESLTHDELETTLEVYGLEDYVWYDPLSTVDTLKLRYAESGFRTPVLEPDLPRVEGGRGILRFAVQEGPLTTVLRVQVSGVGAELNDSVAAIVQPLEGRAFRDAAVDDARRRIEAIYRARGYNNVEVTPGVAFREGNVADLSMAVVPGAEQRLQEVVVDGATRTRPSAVVTALRLEPGEPVDFASWAQARKRLYDTNIFRQVDVRPEVLPEKRPDGAEAVRARVTVTEWPVWRLRYGVQFNDTNQASLGGDTSVGRARGLGVVGDLQNRNTFGRALTFGLYGRLERDLASGNTYLTFPTLFGRAVQTNVFTSAARQDLSLDDTPEPDLRRTKQLVSVEQRIRRGRSFELTYGYRLTHELLKPFDPEDLFLQETVVGRFTSTALLDRRDDPFDSRRGWFGSMSAERLSEFESNDDSIKLLATYYRYQTIGPLTLASAARVGTSLLAPLSFTERFYLGGADTVRGYGENTVGPKDLGGFARGGNAMLVLNQEVRAPIYGWLKGVLFIDAGNVFSDNRLTFSDLQVGYGAGVRLHTPFSILRVDLGVPARTGTKRWYFGIGQTF